MNFFGHAALACRKSDAPAFVLGSMLPDFWAMIRARSPVLSHADIESGVSFHHVTDEAFHDAPSFRELTRWAVARLQERGLERGRARAVAHVGIEILLDAELARDEPARRAYLGGLAAAAPSDLGRFIAWRDADEAGRFAVLCERLASRGVAADDASPELVAWRLERALSGRRRLALGGADVELVRLWCQDATPRVQGAAEDLLSEVTKVVAKVSKAPTHELPES